eukprot:6197293-Pleurochrysis_carterae.AAC.6
MKPLRRRGFPDAIGASRGPPNSSVVQLTRKIVREKTSRQICLLLPSTAGSGCASYHAHELRISCCLSHHSS